jgi:site-specific recombinase XerD
MAKILAKRYVDSKGNKVGCVISIQELGLNTQVVVKSKTKGPVTARLNEINTRIEKARGKGNLLWGDWSLKEKRHWIKTGSAPTRLSPEVLTLHKAIDNFIEAKRKVNKARNTVKGYTNNLQRAKEFFSDVPLKHITAAHAQDYVEDLSKTVIERGKNIGSRLGNKSIQKHVNALKSVFRWANFKRQQEAPWEVFNSVDYPVQKTDDPLSSVTAYCDFEKRRDELRRLGIPETKEGAFRKIIFTRQQLEHCLKTLNQKLWQDGTNDSRRLYAAVVFCAYTGTRRSELCRIKVSNIVLDDQTASISKRKGRSDKEFWFHKMELLDVVMESLRGVIAQTKSENRECVFVADDAHVVGNSVDEKNERLKAEKLSRDLKRSFKDTIYSNLNGWHLFRHTIASILLSNATTEREIEEIIGWRPDSKMVRNYVHVLAKRKRKTLEVAFSDNAANQNEAANVY